MREYFECKCGTDMRVIALDKMHKRITYKCPECGEEETLTFEEAKDLASKNYKYFKLSADGYASWKCPVHGNCDGAVGLGVGLNKGLLEALYSGKCPYCIEDKENIEDM